MRGGNGNEYFSPPCSDVPFSPKKILWIMIPSKLNMCSRYGIYAWSKQNCELWKTISSWGENATRITFNKQTCSFYSGVPQPWESIVNSSYFPIKHAFCCTFSTLPGKWEVRWTNNFCYNVETFSKRAGSLVFAFFQQIWNLYSARVYFLSTAFSEYFHPFLFSPCPDSPPSLICNSFAFLPWYWLVLRFVTKFLDSKPE